MRTLQEKYNGVNEGAFSKDQFLRDARLQLPNLVSQYNGYDDAVQILKNRGMIQEEKSEMSTADLMKKIDEMPAGELAKDIFKGVSKDVLDGLKNLAKKGKKKLGDALVKFGYLEPGDLNEAKKQESFKIVWDKAKLTRTTYENGKQYSSQKFKSEEALLANKEKADKVQKEREEKGRDKITHTLKEARLTKSNLTDYRYKPTNDMDKYPYEQILRGLRVELEGLGVLGTPTPEQYTKALAKVLKNLEKDGIFYTNQIAGIKANKKRTDLMIDATPKTVVDKENGMQKAALKEAIKGVIKNILKEDDSSVSGLYDDEDQYKMYPGDQDVYGAQEVDEELWDLFSPYIHDDSDIEDQMDAYKEGGFSALSKELQDHLKDDERFKNWTSMYGQSEVEGDEDDEDFSRDLPFEGVDEVATDVSGFPKWRELSQDEKDRNTKSAKDSGDRDQAAYEKRREERLKAQSQRLEKHIRGGKENEGIGLSPEVFEATDTEADKNMVRRLMAMYETEPSKFETLHKQAQVQAATTSGVKFKHILSLLNRAKAGALQSLSNQDRFEADREGMYESVSLFDILDEGSSKHSTEWHKGYKAFNDDKKLSSNPYKENPQKKDWAAGWDKAQSDESDSYKGY